MSSAPPDLDKRVPGPDEIRRVFEDLSINRPLVYRNLDLTDFFLGYLMARGLSACEAVQFVDENPIEESP